MPFISYAQNYEDVILWRALRDVEHGFYVDVGAADPQDDSVTNAFYERGWSGINIEPLDEYFRKLTKARPRDTNINAAIGQEAGLRILYAFAVPGLSTLDPEIAARQQAAGCQACETVVPVLTLKAILERCAGSTIHFLKIDVEGGELDVLKGLDLNSVRPWIIVIEGTAPSFVVEGCAPISQVGTRENWENLIIDCDYSFAYFDGLNCFYVADEVAALKDRLAVPPNVFDDFVRFPEWAIRQEAGKLQQEIARLQGYAGGLEAASRAEQEQTANLQKALHVEQEQTANLQKALHVEQEQTANLQHALRFAQEQTSKVRRSLEAEQAQMNHLRGRVHQLEVELAIPSVDRAIGRAFRQVQKTGDKLTGGGLRSLARRALTKLVQRSMHDQRLLVLGRAALRPFPKVSTALYELATKQHAVAPSSTASPAERPPSDGSTTVGALPVSARSTYMRLKAAISDSDAWNRTQ